MEDEFLVLLKDRFRVWAERVDPELQHAACAGERAGNFSFAFKLAGVADINDYHVIALGSLDRLKRAERLDFGIGLVDQGLDAAMDGLGHVLRFRSR